MKFAGRKLAGLLAVAVLALILFAIPAYAVGPVVGPNCSVQWTEPTTNTDGSPLTDLKEYRFYVSTAPGVYAVTPNKVIVATVPTPPANSTKTSTCPTGMSDGQKYAVMTAVDLANNESARSNEYPFVYDTVKPGTVTIQITGL